MDVIAEVWRRVLATQPVPPPSVVALTAVLAAALVVLRSTWPMTRMLITIVHEGGHGVAALLAGRRLHGIRLHSDTSGLTVSSGRPSGPGMVLMLAAGYLAPAVVGLGAVLALLTGHSLGLLWVFAVLLLLLLIQIRNGHGALVVLGVLVALVAASWYLPAVALSTLAYVLTWLLLIGAPKPVIELIRHGRRHRGQSDADQLGRLTRTPTGGWLLLFLVSNLAGLVLGTALLLPALIRLAQQLAASWG